MSNFGSNYSGVTLKALLENPNLQNPPVSNAGGKKNKFDNVQYDFGSAFLGPNLWDTTYNDPDFNLEYMDLDEFLQENGIPNEELAAVVDGDSSAQMQVSCPSSPEAGNSPSRSHQSPTPNLSSMMLNLPSPGNQSRPISPGSRSPNKSPGIPDVHFSVTPQDLQLVTVPGQEFDPRKRAFTEEELKPQPLIKKSKKIFVHDERKDDKYWARRNKNNTAAKRSRDARRLKENQIAMRAAFLEKENDIVKAELQKIKNENTQLKARLSKYE